MNQQEFSKYIEDYFKNNLQTIDNIKLCIIELSSSFTFFSNSIQRTVSLTEITNWVNGFISHPNNKNLSFNCIINYLSFSFFDTKYGFNIVLKD